MHGGISSYSNWACPINNTFNIGKIDAIKGKAYFISPNIGGTTCENDFYLEGSAKDIGLTSSIMKTENELKSQEFVDKLNTYVTAYNNEHKNDEGFIELKRWKYNEGSYPTFE